MSSSIASTSKASHTCRWICASEQRRRSGRGGKRRTWPPYSTRLRLPLLPFLPDQKTVTQHDQGSMAMETMPQSPLILIPSQQLFGILKKALDLMSPMHVLDQHLQRCRGPEVTPVIAAIAAHPRQRSFANQPADLPLALAILTPRPHGMELGSQPPMTAFAPADGPPAPTGTLSHDRIHPLQRGIARPCDPHAEICPDGHDIPLVAGLQTIQELRVVAVVGVGGHARVRYAPLPQPIQQRQGNLRLGLELHVVGDVGLGAACGIRTPLLGQIQLRGDRPGDGPLGVVAVDTHLAVSDLAN